MLNFHRILISLNVTEGAGAIWADSCILDAHQDTEWPTWTKFGSDLSLGPAHPKPEEL